MDPAEDTITGEFDAQEAGENLPETAIARLPRSIKPQMNDDAASPPQYTHAYTGMLRSSDRGAAGGAAMVSSQRVQVEQGNNGLRGVGGQAGSLEVGTSQRLRVGR